MAALLPSWCIFALARVCAWSFLTARLFYHRSCQPFWGPSEMAVWRGPHLVPKLCQANSKIWLFHEGWAGVWSPPGWRVTGMCFLRLTGLELPALESLQWAVGQQAVPAPALLCRGAGEAFDG